MYDPSFTIALKIKTKNNTQEEGLWRIKKFEMDIFSPPARGTTPEKVSPRGEFLGKINKK